MSQVNPLKLVRQFYFHQKKMETFFGSPCTYFTQQVLVHRWSWSGLTLDYESSTGIFGIIALQGHSQEKYFTPDFNINTAINLYNLHSLISECYFNNLFYSLHTLIFTIITHSCGYLIVTILVTYSCSIYLYSTFIFIRLRCLHSSWCLQIHFNSFCNLILCNTWVLPS